MVVVTAWAGFYLGSMQSGISSVQRGLLDTLLGIGLVSAGPGALNQAWSGGPMRCMMRTANRPLAAGRYPLGCGSAGGHGALALGAWWLLLHTNLLTVALALLTAFTYVAIYTPLKRVTTLATFIGAFPGAMGPMLGWTAARGRIEWPAVALFAHSFCLAVSAFHGHCVALSRRLRPGGHPHAAGGAARWLVDGDRGAVLRGADDSGEPGAVAAGHDRRGVCRDSRGDLGLFYLAYTIRFARILRTTSRGRRAASLARDLLKVSVMYLPLLMTTLMLCAIAKH